MGFINNLVVFVMKGVKYVLGLIVITVLVSCSRWPTVVVGDSSGYLQYNRATGILEILWEKHVEVRDSAKSGMIPEKIEK